ncbi:MAG: ribonuclease P protein component [Ignavibacteriae bacterium]|nr:MAG: ribonuclease P protein component [Ignavibacteriota bacterium]
MKNYTLSKNERLKLKKDFLKVYSEGKQLISLQKILKVNYYWESSVNESNVKAAFVVSKKSGNAVWRNRVKRLLREVYRHNKEILNNVCSLNNLDLLIVFTPYYINQKRNRVIKLDFIVNDFIGLLVTLKNKIENA